MSLANQLPRHLRPKRAKVFGDARGAPLDGNAKARIMAHARSWNARHRQPGQHTGPLTRAYLDVLRALLWGFHNSRDGRCFPSHKTIAAKAVCHPDTVNEAIKALETAGIMEWVHRLARIRMRVPDLFGKWGWVWKVIRTSNAYSFRDPLPGQSGRPKPLTGLGNVSDPENPGGTGNPESFPSESPPKTATLDPSHPFYDVLSSYGRAGSLIPETKPA